MCGPSSGGVGSAADAVLAGDVAETEGAADDAATGAGEATGVGSAGGSADGDALPHAAEASATGKSRDRALARTADSFSHRVRAREEEGSIVVTKVLSNRMARPPYRSSCRRANQQQIVACK